MDLIGKSVIFISTPILLYLSQISYQLLLTTLVIFNPFTFIISIEALQYIATPRASNYLVLNVDVNIEDSSNNNNDIIDPTTKEAENMNKVRAYKLYCLESYYKVWLISAHSTFLAVFEYYLVSSLQLSVSETSLLLLSYMILLILLIDLKYNTQLSKKSRRFIQLSSNVLHLAILGQLAYFNLTFSCAPRLSSLFGTNLLIPSDCSYAQDNQVARMAMFCGINSSQILSCQLAFLLMNSITSKQLKI